MIKEGKNNEGLLSYLNAIIDRQGGLKTKVVVEVSTASVLKTTGLLLMAGIGIAVVAHLLKNVFVDKGQLAILNELKKLNKR